MSKRPCRSWSRAAECSGRRPGRVLSCGATQVSSPQGYFTVILQYTRKPPRKPGRPVALPCLLLMHDNGVAVHLPPGVGQLYRLRRGGRDLQRWEPSRAAVAEGGVDAVDTGSRGGCCGAAVTASGCAHGSASAERGAAPAGSAGSATTVDNTAHMGDTEEDAAPVNLRLIQHQLHG
eukprot:gene16963-biopygen20331